MKTTDGAALKIGDTITGFYHDVPFVGVIDGYDGSCGVSVAFPAPMPQPVAYGSARETLYIHRNNQESDVRARLVSRPAEVPEIGYMPATCIGGAYARTSLPIATLAEIEAAGKAAVARKDAETARVLRLAYRAIRDAQAQAA